MRCAPYLVGPSWGFSGAATPCTEPDRRPSSADGIRSSIVGPAAIHPGEFPLRHAYEFGAFCCVSPRAPSGRTTFSPSAPTSPKGSAQDWPGSLEERVSCSQQTAMRTNQLLGTRGGGERHSGHASFGVLWGLRRHFWPWREVMASASLVCTAGRARAWIGIL